MKRPAAFVLLLAAFSLHACTSAAPPPEPPQPIALAPCDEASGGGEFLCGAHEVWENRDTREGRRISLHVVVAPATGDEAAADPLFYFMGGPGGSAAEAVVGVSQFLAPIRERRDLVFVDQRGTGKSHPLRCEAIGSAEDLQGYFEDFLGEEMARDCRAELEKIADLTQYTTSIAADDLEEVRQALGYGQINLVGGSYGTRAAQVYMRRHPESVRASILLGVAGFDQHLPLYHARDAQRSMDLVFEACLAEEACATAFPELGQALPAILERLQAEPARVSIPNPATGESVEVSISRDAFAEGIRFLTYAPITASVAPLMVYRAYEGDYKPFAMAALNASQGLRGAMYMGMHLSVTCAEDVPYIDRAGIDAATDGTFLDDYRVGLAVESCDVWPRGEIPADFHDPVAVEVPTLLVSGGRDPVTPPSWADEVDRHLPSSLHVVVPGSHHGAGGMTNAQCLVDLQNEFLEAGTVEDLDTSCVETMENPPFVTDPEVFAEMMAALGGGLPPPDPDAEEGAGES